MIKRLKYIFIPVLAVFFMSHNVWAVTTIYDLDNYEVIHVSRAPTLKCFYSDNTSGNESFCNSSYSKRITGFDTSLMMPANGFAFNKNDLIEFDLTFYFSDFPANLSSFGVLRLLSNNSNFTIIDYSVTQDTLTNSNGNMVYNSATDYLTNNEYAGVLNYHILVQLANNYRGSFGITEGSNIPFITQNFYDNSAGNIGMFMSNWKIYRKSSSNSINKEQKEATQDAADDSSTAGDSSTSDATSATSSLLSVIGSGIGAITSATPSNCKINGNMGNLNMGQIDLCANPVPTFVAVIGSFIAVALVLPLVIILFNRFISIIRSFQS